MEQKLLSEEIYEVIKRKIINLQYVPGQILNVQQVAAELDISRTPVREAMVRLKEDDFLEETQSRKFRVREITWKYIEDLYDLRFLLESTAISKSIDVVTEEQVNKLREYNEKMCRALAAKDYQNMFDYDYSFHAVILALYDNQLMQNVGMRFRDHQQQIRFITTGIERRMLIAGNEHESIIDGIARHDANAAIASLSAHLHGTVDDFAQLRRENVLFGSFIK